MKGVSPAELRALLPIYLDSFFTLPVTRADGTKLDYEEVVKQLDAETLSYSIDINSPLQEGVTLKIKVPKEKYTKAIAWLSDLLYNSSFSVDRSVSCPHAKEDKSLTFTFMNLRQTQDLGSKGHSRSSR